MSFPQAVSSAFRQYVGFRGRARRSEYWYFFLFTLLLGLVTGSIDGLLGLADDFGNGPVGGLASLAVLLPSLAVGARRLHDTGRSGWWLLIGLVPLVGAIILIVFFCQDSAPGANEHGPSPKDPGVGYAAPYGAPPVYGAPPAYGSQPGPDPRFGTPPQQG